MPTSPVNSPISPAQIEAVFGDEPEALEANTPAATMLAEWRRFGAFLKRPTLDVAQQDTAPLKVLARIYVLDLLAMCALVLAAAAAVAAGLYLPETAIAGMEFTPTLILAVVIGAPVFEELVFRSWLSGKPGHILALLAVAAGAVGFGAAHVFSPIAGIVVLAVCLIGAGAALIGLYRRPAMGWFARFFPGFFWFATASFALVHLANFDSGDTWGSLAILLPLVLPQFLLGTMVGYMRVRIGLWAAIMLHAAHNATAVSLAAMAGQLN